MNIHVAVSDIRHDVSKIREENSDQVRSVSAITIAPSSGEYLYLLRTKPGQKF